MQNIKRFLFLAFLVLFMCLPVVSAGTVGFFSQDWTHGAYAIVYPGALDVVGQIAYFGSHDTFGPPYTNYLYAVNITNGNQIWRYNTSLPVNCVSNFTYNTNTYIIAGTGDSTVLPTRGGYVLALSPQNVTLWPPFNLGHSVQSLGAAGTGVPNNEDIIAGLANGTVVSLSGSNGLVQWRYQYAGNMTAGNVPNIVQLDNGSIAVGTAGGGQGHVYCIEKNGSSPWNYTSTSLHLVKRFGSLNDVVAAFTDVVDIRNGTTGAEIARFNATKSITPFNVTKTVTDVLCTEDYTEDGFPDIVVGTENTTGGFLMILNGSDVRLLRGPVQVSSFTLSYIQYMYSYENSVPLLNKTLAISIENSSLSSYVCGVNASDLTVIKEFPVSATAMNLVNVANSTSYAGDLLFSAGNTVYRISGTDIIVSEFPSQIMLVIVVFTLWISVMILRRRKSRVN